MNVQKGRGSFFGFNATRAIKREYIYLLASGCALHRFPELKLTAIKVQIVVWVFGAPGSLNVSAINETMVDMAIHSCPY